MLGWIFIRSGYGKLFNIEAVAASFPPRGVPYFMAYVSVPVEFFGGVALLLGLATRYVALLMGLFTVIATLVSHRYWDFTEAAVRRAHESSFWKNVAIVGGFFQLVRQWRRPHRPRWLAAPATLATPAASFTAGAATLSAARTTRRA